MTHTIRRKRPCNMARCIAQMVRMLLKGKVSAARIAEETGLSIHTVRLWVGYFRRQDVVYESGRGRDKEGKNKVRLYSMELDMPDEPYVNRTLEQERIRNRLYRLKKQKEARATT